MSLVDDIDPIFNIHDTTEVLGAWFLGGIGHDWLCTVLRTRGELEWVVGWRFRGHVDQKVFDSDDHKESTKIRTSAPDDEVIAMVDRVAHNLVAKGFNRGGGRLWRRIIKDRSPHTFAAIIKSAPFVHVSTPEGLDAVPTTNERGKA